MKKIFALIVLATMAIIFVGYKTGRLPGMNRETDTERTENVVKSVREIAELTTATYYEEVALIEAHESSLAKNPVIRSFSTILGNKKLVGDDQLCIIAKGTVRAGYDLKELKAEDLRIAEDTLYVSLPKAKVLDVIINPSGYDIVVETGKWTQQETAAVKDKAKDRIRHDALEAHILDKAKTSGTSSLTSLFKSLGFRHVILK